MTRGKKAIMVENEGRGSEEQKLVAEDDKEKEGHQLREIEINDEKEKENEREQILNREEKRGKKVNKVRRWHEKEIRFR